MQKTQEMQVQILGREVPLEEEMATHSPRASSAKTRGFHTQLDEGPETP